MNQRDKAIQTISCLYPADSEFEKTNEIGRDLLRRAKEEANNWRNEPTEVLIVYARLCEEHEERL